MISSRTHASIDYATIAALAGGALSSRLSRGTRLSFAAAALFRTAYAAATGYEGGLVGRIGMGDHLLLDAAGAAGVALSGLFAPADERPLLLGVAAAELLVVAASDRRATSGVPRTTYDPLDVPKPFADGLWIVDSVLGPGLPVRMAVIRLENGDLLLHSPTRYGLGLRRALERLGRIRHLVAPNSAHWVFMKSWQDAVPEAQAWAAPGLRERGQVRRSGLRVDGVLSSRAPPAWDGQVEQQVVPGGAGFREVAMFHRASQTLLLADLAQNWEPSKLPWPLRAPGRLLGAVGPVGRAPAHLRAVVALRRRDAAVAARRIVAWEPAKVLLAHGAPWEHAAAARLRQSFGWLLRD